MKRFVRLVLTLILLTVAACAHAYKIPYEAWMGSYIGEKKVGYLSFKIEKSDGKDSSVYKISSVMNNHLTVLGAELTQLVATVVYTDAQYAPLSESFSMSSGGKTTRIDSKFTNNSINCIISAGSGSSKQSIPIPKGVSLVGDSLFALPGGKMKIGKEYSLSYFNPLTISIDSLKIKAEGREKITIGKKQYDALVVMNTSALGDMKTWQSDEGDILKIQAMMGIIMIMEDRRTAMSGITIGGGDDFAVRNSLKPDKEILNPRSVKELDIILKGFSDPKMMINDKQQTFEAIDGQKDSVRVKTKASTFDESKSVSFPFNPVDFALELLATPYVDSDVAAIKTAATKIIGDEKNVYRACCKIREWIYANMKPKADIGITRSASDVLQSKVGVCRDYAILFAALTRAAGIPSRIASGVLYTNGSFYYHAWVECYVGEWVPFDATLSQNQVDATHIKMAQGDATTMFALSKVIGSLKAEIKDYK
ncbi:MAG: transglutaminase-like domain-containing protein [Armatimonadetes bacterium]|nr:transglutaminase-like domain-containing protein [Armatimonadota bacterium]